MPNRSPFILSEAHERGQELVFRLQIAGGGSIGIPHHVRIRWTTLSLFPITLLGWTGVYTSIGPQLLKYFLRLSSRGVLVSLLKLVFKSAALDPVVVTEGDGREQQLKHKLTRVAPCQTSQAAWRLFPALARSVITTHHSTTRPLTPPPTDESI